MELDSRRRGVDGVESHGDGAVMELNVTETGGDGVSFKILDGDGALMELIILYGAVMVFNFKLRADL